MAARRRGAEPFGEEVLQFQGVGDAPGGEAGPQRSEVGEVVTARLRGQGERSGGEDRVVGGPGEAPVDGGGAPGRRGDVLGFVEGVGEGGARGRGRRSRGR